MSEARGEHLLAMDVAAYVDGVAAADVRDRIDAHLGECADCRDEVVHASKIAAALSRSKGVRWRLWVPLVAAASLVFILVRPEAVRQRMVAHRESPVTTTVAPQGVAPVGLVDSLTVLTWSSVPRSDRYRVRVFDADGTVVWELATADTVAGVPRSISLVPGRAYFWKVEAQTGFGRTAATELIEFTVRHERRP